MLNSTVTGHVFLLHQHRNGSADLYQSFIKTYNLGQHMDWYEQKGLRPMNRGSVKKHVLAKLETLITATEWTGQGKRENDLQNVLTCSFFKSAKTKPIDRCFISMRAVLAPC